MIWVSSSKPEIDGRSTSVNTRSMSSDLFFNVSHAFNPSRNAATAFYIVSDYIILYYIYKNELQLYI